jgi:hypothetical protein
MGEPGGVLCDAVELIAVRDPQPPAVGGHVDTVFEHFDVAEGEAGELSRHRIVVAGQVHHARALARLAQEFAPRRCAIAASTSPCAIASRR